MGVGRNTIAKYREGDPKEWGMYGIQQSKLDPYYDFIVQCLNIGWSKSKTVKAIYEKGYTGSTSNVFRCINFGVAKLPYAQRILQFLMSHPH